MPTIYRIIAYTGPQEWIDQQLDRSIHGEKRLNPECSITAATIDPRDVESIEFSRDYLRNFVAKINESDQ